MEGVREGGREGVREGRREGGRDGQTNETSLTKQNDYLKLLNFYASLP